SQLAQSPQSGPDVELNFIRDLMQQYGHPDDRVLDPAQFSVLLNRDREPVTPQQVGPGVMLLSLGELHSGIVAQVQEALYLGDFSRGLILDLRGSVGV
ncbi:MAG: peptidase S41, partial [Synechococcaceae cyanobacterium SM2_3_60]|nr:peptidase S41 [Synechococcaceae cyanobacterium SM2_3_60]